MKVKIKNLGILKQAEFSLGDLTIICGSNNTGKTYATYSLFGFLYTWRRLLTWPRFGLKEKIEQLLSDGVISLDLQEYVQQCESILTTGCQRYIQQIPEVFAANEERFKNVDFQIELNFDNIQFKKKYERKISTATLEIISISKPEDEPYLSITLLTETEKINLPVHFLEDIIYDSIKDIIFSQFFPRPFIASAERTGAAIFRKELNFARNRLLEEISKNSNFNPRELLFNVSQDYALPVKENVDFTRQIETIVKKTSFIAENHPSILEDFADIIGGQYMITSNDELYYIPKGKKLRLSMDESSSAVRSLLDIGFYLRHEARIGDLLIVDEPELNLHPENQRRIAKLFARLINIGIKVFITTHSDYIIKEINTLIMLNHDQPHLKEIAVEEGYRQEELLSADQVKVYIAEQALEMLKGKKRKTKFNTLTPAKIDPEMGIEARSFDTTIEKMNRIQTAIIWGEE
ncbi:MAG: ATP-binding protein [Microcystis panniformis Mp_MB_F_20051200_S9]|uniref:ATP-binding protein n=1 Tax=Microcystis panniformis Mp_MB_F_20051200_S9 TaxID=2486223 RepID=A0A552QBS3_9CHRO|nr:MAG: ATP-binding protein [Microcystis panniformis Mp_MB_F_20080800_S26D]TRV51081.1 MAG: ATP-binding protein [Microcystis panniformis Mp_GB_SS_20050300_S99D]TRV53332.1 MAG: ATP-binding protein [Microcystis panniformis Mp_GB_SS_20050300_S99]TRV55031.1 MAG: ATP-binding protein [Microcystis panniformis Mp_MB_F_20080800_S26]TRV64919.1 MAG: ATP-binding protein [Microcystis panniformis Mp_MB_F_20051200_S9D]TRV66677.1 MAG: ATP-binding protein [Microcystis panniformis Mp_MB_F_20051200_S9]TRV69417.1